MTPSTSRVVNTVDEMLLDAGQAQADELRAALLALGSLGTVPPPEPNAELSALLAGQPDQLAHRRRLKRRRSGFVGLAVIAGMGLGVTGVAAGAPAAGTTQASISVQHLLEDWAPSWTIAAASPSGTGGLIPGLAPVEVPVAADQPLPAPTEHPATPTLPAPGRTEAGGNSPARTPARSATEGAGAAAKGAEASNVEDAAGAARQPGKSQDAHAPAKDNDEVARQLEGSNKELGGVLANGSEAQEALKSAVPATGTTARTGAGKANPGAAWLKKFRR